MKLSVRVWCWLVGWLVVGATAPSGPWPPHSRGFQITHDSPHSIGLLWTSDQLVTETLTTHNSHSRQTFMPPVGFEPTIFSRRAAADLRLRLRGHWDRPCMVSAVSIPYTIRAADTRKLPAVFSCQSDSFGGVNKNHLVPIHSCRTSLTL